MSCDTPARLTHYSGRCHLNHIKVKSSQVKSATPVFHSSVTFRQLARAEREKMELAALAQSCASVR